LIVAFFRVVFAADSRLDARSLSYRLILRFVFQGGRPHNFITQEPLFSATNTSTEDSIETGQ